MLIVDLEPGEEESIRQTATLLVEGFKDNWPDAWPNMDAALVEVRESFGEGRISRVALDEGGTVLGWIGGIPSYEGNVWELHPLVVRTDIQRRGIGSALVTDLEERVRERGGLTLWLGTDDETGMTTLSGVDLYPNLLEHLANIKIYAATLTSSTPNWASPSSGRCRTRTAPASRTSTWQSGLAPRVIGESVRLLHYYPYTHLHLRQRKEPEAI
jgi:aminoglycoside 6'-N-acetyltransferase I